MDGALDLSSKPSTSSSTEHLAPGSATDDALQGLADGAVTPSDDDTVPSCASRTPINIAPPTTTTGTTLPENGGAIARSSSTPSLQRNPYETLAEYYSQLASQTSALSTAVTYPYPGCALAMLPQMGLMSDSLSLPSSPMEQYLLARRRKRSQPVESAGASVTQRQVSAAATERYDATVATPCGSLGSGDNESLSMQPLTIHAPEQSSNSSETNSDAAAAAVQTQNSHPQHQLPYTAGYSPSPTTPQLAATPNCTATGDVTSPSRGTEASGSVCRELSYWDRRRKNNEAAKRSRDARRVKEEEIAVRAALLEQENLKLRAQVSVLKSETAKLHFMLYNS